MTTPDKKMMGVVGGGSEGGVGFEELKTPPPLSAGFDNQQ
jgi:hypothetical protein